MNEMRDKINMREPVPQKLNEILLDFLNMYVKYKLGQEKEPLDYYLAEMITKILSLETDTHRIAVIKKGEVTEDDERVCAYCGETGFDSPGLEYHLTYCEPYKNRDLPF